jgi:methylated-DNA-[protein]-cysteine S-methyltransferase
VTTATDGRPRELAGDGPSMAGMVTFATELGDVGLTWTDAGIDHVTMPRKGGLHGEPLEAVADVPAFVHDAVEGIVALLAGEQRDLADVRLDETVVDRFNLRVYRATRAIPPGETRSYGEIARALGVPDAARAVGTALGANPYPIIVPCHRVLGADGRLTGFSAPGGIATKRRMLEIERAPGFVQGALFA